MSLLTKALLAVVAVIVGGGVYMINKSRKDTQSIIKDALPALEIKETVTNVMPGIGLIK